MSTYQQPALHPACFAIEGWHTRLHDTGLKHVVEGIQRLSQGVWNGLEWLWTRAVKTSETSIPLPLRSQNTVPPHWSARLQWPSHSSPLRENDMRSYYQMRESTKLTKRLIRFPSATCLSSCRKLPCFLGVLWCLTDVSLMWSSRNPRRGPYWYRWSPPLRCRACANETPNQPLQRSTNTSIPNKNVLAWRHGGMAAWLSQRRLNESNLQLLSWMDGLGLGWYFFTNSLGQDRRSVAHPNKMDMADMLFTSKSHQNHW